MREATSKQIDNSVDHNGVDEGMGYGYQFWMLPHGGFAFNGMGGQFGLCLPYKDLAIVTTGYEQLNSHGRNEVFRALWRELYPHLSDAPLPADPEAAARLQPLADSLELLRPDGALSSPTGKALHRDKPVLAFLRPCAQSAQSGPMGTAHGRRQSTCRPPIL